MKFCKDCRFYKPGGDFHAEAKRWRYAKCFRAAPVTVTNAVTGETHTTQDYAFCEEEREDNEFRPNKCGVEAKHFAPKLEEVSA